MEFGPVNEAIVSAFLLPEIEFLLRTVPQLEFLKYSPTLLLTAFYGGAMALILGAKNAREHMLAFRPTVRNLSVISLLLFWCVMSFSGISTFLYFNF